MKIGIAGYGYVGQAHKEGLEWCHEILISDPAKKHYADLNQAEALIISVSTPQGDDGSCYMENVYSVLENLNIDIPILIKSTISLEGWEKIKQKFPNKQITFSPEFLRAQTALQDFKKSKQFYLGGGNTNFWGELLVEALGQINVDIAKPEELILVKYFRNSFLATKVSFFNQIFDLCESMENVDYDKVKELITVDKRIGDSHSSVTEQRGFGGHCFPKDTQAIANTADKKNVNLSLLKEAIKYNNKIRKD